MASHGAGEAAGTDAVRTEVTSPHSSLALGHHSWSSSVSWNYHVYHQNQDTVYYDPQRDVLVSGGNENLTSSAPLIVQSTIGTENTSYSHVPYSSSLQHGYNCAEYPNYYYNYTQTTNDSSVQQDGANQNSGAAYQTLTSFQNSRSYVGPTSNTYYNAGGHQTIPGYGTSSYYYQNNDWNGGSLGNNCNQSYQNYSASDNAVHSSSSVPGNSQSYQQQYNQWPYYYNHPVPSATGNLVAGNISTDNGDVSATSGYSRYPSVQPPPPGTTTWTSNSSASVAPPMQAPGVPEPQSQYVNQAQNMSGSQNQYVSQAPAFAQNTVNFNNVALNRYEDQQKTVSVTTDTSSESKIQISTNPQIAPGFSMVIPKSEKKNLGADLAKKHAYVSVSMPKNDAKAAQRGPEAQRSYCGRATKVVVGWKTVGVIEGGSSAHSYSSVRLLCPFLFLFSFPKGYWFFNIFPPCFPSKRILFSIPFRKKFSLFCMSFPSKRCCSRW